jgi:hypothetical protein
MIKKIHIILCVIIALGCNIPTATIKTGDWDVTILPSSVRLDPVTSEIIENRFEIVPGKRSFPEDLLKRNWIYNGNRVSLHGARGEYISFQIVLRNYTDSILKNIHFEMLPFKNKNSQLKIKPEFFLEWSVKVITPSTGYPRASLGKGWYPDALIPFSSIQDDTSGVNGRWTFPLWLPDFNNRIENQKCLLIWVDQFIPFEYEDAGPGIYSTGITVKIGDRAQHIPVDLNVWNFAIPNENKFRASLQQEGFLSNLDEKKELEVYQLFKRNRISLMDPTYKPGLQIGEDGKIKIDWTAFDERMKKYFSGEAFTNKYGYRYGPGYGEPLEVWMPPFDVYGKHRTPGWPDIGKPEVERAPANKKIYIEALTEVRNHLLHVIDPRKTDVTAYLNGLDESYFREAYERMIYYGDLFHKYYPEAHFRIDGSYDEAAMEMVHKSIDYWAAHTINYNIDQVKKYQQLGIKDWLYGPMIYESKVNSWVGSSTFIDLPLINDRAISWSCWKYNTYSWISWGIGVAWESAWYDPESWKDVYKGGADSDPDFTYKKLNGNALLVYGSGIIPNVDVPCPSIRLKTMRNGVQEYEYMRLLSDLDKSKDRVNKIVNSIIKKPFGDRAIGNLDVWSYDAKLWDQGRLQLGELISQKQ